jgi:predicted dinucleotide-binding enzyme
MRWHHRHRILSSYCIDGINVTGIVTMKKKVAVIGAAGHMGSAIAYRIAAAGYPVLLSDDIENHRILLLTKLPLLLGKIRYKVPRSDVRIALSEREASWEADVIIPAVPYRVQPLVADKIKDVVTGKIVISLINPLIKPYIDPATAPGTSAAEELAQLLPHSKIIKAFNTIFAAQIAGPEIAGKASAIFVAGDDEDATSTVVQLAKDMGFHAISAGTLAASRKLENMMAMLTHLPLGGNQREPEGRNVLQELPIVTKAQD